MELLLILVVGGLAAWLMRPLRDWYVLEVQDASGASLEKSIFSDLAAAQQDLDQRLQTRAKIGAVYGIRLWHVEARSRSQAAKLMPAGGHAPVCLRSTDS